jgi:hypothetical protein
MLIGRLHEIDALPAFIGSRGIRPERLRPLGQNRSVPMRTDCRHYESRTYAGGEVVRKCRLDLAPEAPWRCPDDCPRFELRRMDAGWQYGSLTTAAAQPEPEPAGDDVAALLDQAEDIVNTAAPEILAEVRSKAANQEKRRLRRRKKR